MTTLLCIFGDRRPIFITLISLTCFPLYRASLPLALLPLSGQTIILLHQYLLFDLWPQNRQINGGLMRREGSGRDDGMVWRLVAKV